MKKIVILAFALVGCATHTGVLPDGKDAYVLIVSQGNGFASAGDLKVAAYKEAGAFCRRDRKLLELISEKIVQAGILSDSAEVDVKFKCVEPHGFSAPSTAITRPSEGAAAP